MFCSCLLHLPVLVWLVILSVTGGVWFNLYQFGKEKSFPINFKQRYFDDDFHGWSFWFYFGTLVTLVGIITLFGIFSLFEKCWNERNEEIRRRRSDTFGSFMRRGRVHSV